MTPADWIGLLAGTLTTTAFVPQVIKIWRTKHADDLSTYMFVIFTLGVALWLWFGVVTASLPVILANSVTLALSVLILAMKFHYRK
jgi:MtN3 and saliva related transmembrane protein